MQVILDPKLKVIERYREPPSVEDFAQTIAYKAKLKGIKGFIGSELNSATETLLPGFLGLVSECYSRHEKLVVQPHDLWFIVLTELAREVNGNPEKYRSLFTNSDEKQDISIPTGAVELIDVNTLVSHLAGLINVPIQAFLPTLSTATPDVIAAFSASFCDMVQSYYSYSTFCCGIPEIEVTGTPEDWAMLATCALALENIFKELEGPQVEKYGLAKGPIQYMANVRQLFITILADVATGEPDVKFWKGIFTSRNVGSGGELEISGWIKDLYLAERPGPKINNFEVSLGVVPYKNLDTGRHFTAIYGAFGVLRTEDGFLTSSYDNVIFEMEPPVG